MDPCAAVGSGDVPAQSNAHRAEVAHTGRDDSVALDHAIERYDDVTLTRSARGTPTGNELIVGEGQRERRTRASIGADEDLRASAVVRNERGRLACSAVRRDDDRERPRWHEARARETFTALG